MKVAVIGSGGFIGKALLRKLKLQGEEVYAFSSQTSTLFHPLTGILNEEFSIPADTSCVIYLAQSPYYKQVPEFCSHLWGVNVVSAIKAAELARCAGVTNFIYASTGNVYTQSFEPLNESSDVRRDDWYSLSKLQAEECLSLYRKSMDISIVRLFGVYGPSQTGKLIPNLIDSIKSGKPIKLLGCPGDLRGDFDGLRISLCYIDDVIEIFTKIITSPVNLINIASPEVLSVREIANTIGCLLSIEPKFESDVCYNRKYDLIADITNLNQLSSFEFTLFSNGIKKTLGIL